MPKHYRHIAALLLLLIVLGGCNTREWFGPSPAEIIVSTPWVVKRFEYTQQYDTLGLGCNLYTFGSEMQYTRTTCDGDTISEGSWEFQQDNAYLRIGPNTFKVISLSKKIMNLRYGDVEMCLLPVKE